MGSVTWSNERVTGVAVGLLDLVGCFCLCSLSGLGDHLDPGCLFAGFQVQLFVQRQFEEALFKTVWLLGASWAAAWTPSQRCGPDDAQMGPEMVQNFLKPTLASEFLRADLVLLIRWSCLIWTQWQLKQPRSRWEHPTSF